MTSTINDATQNTNLNTNDPFADLSKLRMSQDFATDIGVEKLILKVNVGKPDKQSWVRVHPHPDYRFETAVLEMKERNEIYLVAPQLWASLANEIVRIIIFTTINRQALVSLWPVKLPGIDGKHNEWHKSALNAASVAMKYWVRVTANLAAKGYDVCRSSAPLSEPTWPDITFAELFKIAFKERYIDSPEHPVLKELRGEV